MSNLFYPTSCPCCGMQDTTLCDLCFARLAERPYRESLAGLDVISCCDYTPAARAFITAYKVMKRMTLAKFMGLIIANQLNVFSSEYGNYSVITMPSTRLSWRSRGFIRLIMLWKLLAWNLWIFCVLENNPKIKHFWIDAKEWQICSESCRWRKYQHIRRIYYSLMTLWQVRPLCWRFIALFRLPEKP